MTFLIQQTLLRSKKAARTNANAEPAPAEENKKEGGEQA